jgi:hypothetical protein
VIRGASNLGSEQAIHAPPPVKSSVPSFAVMMLTSDDCKFSAVMKVEQWRFRRFWLSS